MSQQRTRSRYDDELLLKAAGEQTSSTTGDSNDFGSLPETCMVQAFVSDVSGTSPTLDIAIEGSEDGDSWTEILSLPQITDSGKIQAAIGAQKYRYYRYDATIGGSDTPSFTYLLSFSC